MTKLIGGSRDGLIVAVSKVGGRMPPFYYVAKRITVEESMALTINDSAKWKEPEEVYEWRDGAYHYTRTVNYKTVEVEE